MGVEYAVNFQVGRAVVVWVLVMAQTVLKMLPTPLFAVVRDWRRGFSFEVKGERAKVKKIVISGVCSPLQFIN